MRPWRAFGEALDRCEAAGLLTVSAADAALLLWASGHGLLMLQLAGNDLASADTDRLVNGGLRSLLAARSSSALRTTGAASAALGSTVATAAALTWLNPHFYLDAVLMLGTVANSFGPDRWWFLSGTLVASVLWFFGLGYGARLLRGLFARPKAWRVLDSGIAVLMGALGVGLIVH